MTLPVRLDRRAARGWMKAEIEDLADRWRQVLEHHSAPARSVERALEGMFELGGRLDACDPEARAAAARDLAASAPLVEGCLEHVGRWVARQVSRSQSTWVRDDWQTWRTLCALRSQLEYLRELYGPFLPAGAFERTELAWLDETLSDNAGAFLPDELIPSVPRSHGWWWFPE